MRRSPSPSPSSGVTNTDPRRRLPTTPSPVSTPSSSSTPSPGSSPSPSTTPRAGQSGGRIDVDEYGVRMPSDSGEDGDDPDDMEASGAEELFGGTDRAADATGTSGGSTSAAKRARTSTSSVWLYLEELTRVVNGKEERYGAICKLCKKQLSGKSASGTGHLLRHVERCKKKALAAGNRSQSMLRFGSDGMGNWEYNAERARTDLCRLIARLDLPLSFGAHPAFVEFIRSAHNPRFTNVSRQTTTRDLEKFFALKCDDVKKSLQSCSSVCLTSDVWSGNAKEDYISVVAHYISDDWELEKRILGFRLIDVSHSGSNIAERIANVVHEFDLVHKVFSVTLDNASSNTSAMDALLPSFSAYVGSVFLHQRCACHIINLIVKSGLKRIKVYLEAFRTAISFLNSSNQRIALYKSYCIAMGVRPRKFGLDMDVRWNSTFLMLKHVLPYKSTFSVFIHTHYDQQVGSGNILLTEDHWYVAQHIFSFLEIFYESTVTLSGVYYPTSPLMMHYILEIACHLNNFENDELLREIVVPMKTKFLKYWKNIPMLYSFAFILDPRAKLTGFSNVLSLLSQALGHDYSGYYNDVKAELNNMFNKYASKFGGTRAQRPPSGPSAGARKKTAWSKIYGAAAAGTSAIPSSGNGPHPQTCSYTSSVSELASYLDSDTATQFDDDFNIINWWQDHKRTYPVLSILAKDVMCVPVSTVSSESAFSLCGRVIEDRRRNLTSQHVEMLMLVKDWELADARTQHTMEDLELEESFENLYLDIENEAAQ